MGELIMYPMRYASFEKGERTCSIVWAKSSMRILQVMELPSSWEGGDATVAITRLTSAGWEETGRGKVQNL